MDDCDKISVKATDSLGAIQACSDIDWYFDREFYGYGYSDCGSVTAKTIELTFVVDAGTTLLEYMQKIAVLGAIYS